VRGSNDCDKDIDGAIGPYQIQAQLGWVSFGQYTTKVLS
jgi:hypothetical protein